MLFLIWFFGVFLTDKKDIMRSDLMMKNWYRFEGAYVMLLTVHFWHYGFLRTPCCMMLSFMSSWLLLFSSILFHLSLLKIYMFLSLCHGLSMMLGFHMMKLLLVCINLDALDEEDMYVMVIVDVD